MNRRMNRIVAAILFALTVATASSEVRRIYFDEVAALTDSTIALPGSPGATPLALEARFKFEKPDDSLWLLWNVTDSANFCAVSVSGVKDNGEMYGSRQRLEIALHNVVAGLDSAEVVAQPEMDYPLNLREHTMAVEAADGGVQLSFGVGNPESVAMLPATFDAAGRFGLRADGAVRFSLVAGEWQADNLPESYKSVLPADEIAALKAAGHAAGSPAGIWEYLDRDTDSRKAMSGGRYRLLIADRGAWFDIIYLDGAETNSDRWKPGQLKGRLIPTRFEGHYDLEWLDAEDRLIDRDANASIDRDVILTLSFPLLSSSLRLSRP